MPGTDAGISEHYVSLETHQILEAFILQMKEMARINLWALASHYFK